MAENDQLADATKTLKDTVELLQSEENRLASELATVKAKRQAVSKALTAMDDTRPRRRRGRPPASAAPSA